MSGRVYCPECGASYADPFELLDVAQCGARLSGAAWCKGRLTSAEKAIRSLARARDTAHAAGYAEAVADVDALRAALTEARAVLSLCNTARNRSVPEYLGVRDIGRNIGYGAMMSAASSAWAEMFDGTPQEGSQHTCGPSEFTVRRAIARIDEVLSPGAHVGAAKKGGG